MSTDYVEQGTKLHKIAEIYGNDPSKWVGKELKLDIETTKLGDLALRYINDIPYWKLSDTKQTESRTQRNEMDIKQASANSRSATEQFEGVVSVVKGMEDIIHDVYQACQEELKAYKTKIMELESKLQDTDRAKWEADHRATQYRNAFETIQVEQQETEEILELLLCEIANDK